ncbi:MAG: GspH/FimT family pseudopilin [Gammaproteobacteria bacterium]|nr:GspH/FimT family pseudopilin [Gammaproteobacteria bacterium]
MKHRTQTGFTLVELIIALGLAAVLLGIGVPAFTDFIRNNRMIGVTNELVTALQFARSEAVKRNNNVTICISTDGATCTGGALWESGWIVFDDVNANAVVDGAQIVRSHAAIGGGNTVRVTAGNVGSFVSFNGNGFPRNVAGVILTATFSVCDARGAVAGVARTVQVGASGRVRSSEVIASCT